MDPQRDTPLKRFGALWIGLFIILSFGLAALLLAPIFTKDMEDPALQEEYDARLAIKEEVDKAQAEQLVYKENGENAQVEPKQAFPYTAKQLLKSKPAKSSQVVPGSPTDLKANAKPAEPAKTEKAKKADSVSPKAKKRKAK